MGKSLKDLLNGYNFPDQRFNPNLVNENMLSPKPDDAFTIDANQVLNFTKQSPQIYGKDIVRIGTQGQVDTKKLTKQIVGVSKNILQNSLGKLGGIAGKISNFAVNELSKTINPRYPSDLVIGTTTDNGLYTAIINGNVKNQKSAVGNFLKSVATPKQFQENIGPFATSVAYDFAQKGIGKLANNIGVGKSNPKPAKISDLLAKDTIKGWLGGKNLPTFPSDTIGDVSGVAIGQSQLSRTGGFVNDYEGVGTFNSLKLKVGEGDTPVYRTTKQNHGTGSLSISEDKGLDGYLDYKENDVFIYRFPNVYNNKVKRFSDAIKDTDSKNIKLFGGYGTKNYINNDHRQKVIDALIDEGGDLIKIRFQLKDGDKFIGKPIYLLSNLKAISDTPTPTWNDVKPIGSPYKFYFYESFEREISFTAQLYATDENNLKLVWDKANRIQQLTLGNWGGSKGIQGTLCSLRIGDMFDSNYGFVTSCNLTVPDVSPWEIQDGSQLPFVCELNITYKVMYDNTRQGFYGPVKGNMWDKLEYDYATKPAPIIPPLDATKVITKPNMANVDMKKLPTSTLSKPPLYGTAKTAGQITEQANNDLFQTQTAESYLNNSAAVMGNSFTIPAKSSSGGMLQMANE